MLAGRGAQGKDWSILCADVASTRYLFPLELERVGSAAPDLAWFFLSTLWAPFWTCASHWDPHPLLLSRPLASQSAAAAVPRKAFIIDQRSVASFHSHLLALGDRFSLFITVHSLGRRPVLNIELRLHCSA